MPSFNITISMRIRKSNSDSCLHQPSPPWGPRQFLAWQSSFLWLWRPLNTALSKPPPNGKRNSWNQPSDQLGDERSGMWTNVDNKRQKVGVSTVMTHQVTSGVRQEMRAEPGPNILSYATDGKFYLDNKYEFPNTSKLVLHCKMLGLLKGLPELTKLCKLQFIVSVACILYRPHNFLLIDIQKKYYKWTQRRVVALRMLRYTCESIWLYVF